MSTAELGEKLPEGVFHLLTTDDDVASAYGSSTAAGGPDPSAQAAQDDDSEPSGYFISECGHRVPRGPAWYVGSCKTAMPTPPITPICGSRPVAVIPGRPPV